ncbi:ester cyclase [Streptomyces sp. GbtcB7]|uniref:ester cyclase n=1 Tax=Streptomyces sp. GbtcB7 TaxID=2824752 RepID=UPI001C2FE7A7|nr:ester cyclase [Streptomyces sp. GbtcB7]
MNTQAKATINSYITDWNSHDVTKILDHFVEDCAYEDAALGVTNRGHDDLRRFLEAFFHSYPNVEFTVTSVFGAEGAIAWEWKMDGNYEQMGHNGMPATGQRISLRGVSITEVTDGKITRNTDYWNFASIMKQLGVLPGGTSQV